MAKKENIVILTINDSEFEIKSEDYDLNNYQPELTVKLDNNTSTFTQELINEIVLWKVNRYVNVNKDLLHKINSINILKSLDEQLTREILVGLLKTKGIRLAMASTILRFKNPNIYQIVDKRICRVIYGKKKLSLKSIEEQIDFYITYLSDLRNTSKEKDIPFELMDRVLYNADKRNNKAIPIEY